MRILHWKVQLHWKTSETTLKNFTKDNHAQIFSLITLKFVCYCYQRMLIPYNPTENFQCYSYIRCSLNFQCYSGFSVWFSVSYSCSDNSRHPTHSAWVGHIFDMLDSLPHQVKMQYLHFRFHANYFLLPWKIPEEISRRSLLFHN